MASWSAGPHPRAHRGYGQAAKESIMGVSREQSAGKAGALAIPDRQVSPSRPERRPG